MPAWLTDLVILAPWLAALGLAVWVGWRVWPTVRKLMHFVDDVAGEPARPGQPARPGLMERIATVETRLNEYGSATRAQREHVNEALAELRHEVMPNDGSSMRDAVVRTETLARAVNEKVDVLDEKVIVLTQVTEKQGIWQDKHERKSDAVVARVDALEQKALPPRP
jgi:hypothetical protein